MNQRQTPPLHHLLLSLHSLADSPAPKNSTNFSFSSSTPQTSSNQEQEMTTRPSFTFGDAARIDVDLKKNRFSTEGGFSFNLK
mmetsp:Transcript_22326/g.28881  ORF Transcript_22326/g.28881 Transcript_22326/m.28881 type:complete len:83 (+) Transcript_22326:1816-2064(+)